MEKIATFVPYHIHMRKGYYLIVFFLLMITYRCAAQVDTEFWFAPPEVSSGHGDRPVYLRISTLDEIATITVVQPARNNTQLASVIVPANTTYTLDLSDQINNMETINPAVVMKTGIHVIASTPVTAYYEVGAPWNADIFALKGKNALGNKFVIPAQNFYNNSAQYSPTPYSSFDIVATKNNTVVKIRPTKPLYGQGTDTLIIVKLNAGETYSCRKMSTLASDNPVGTLVESNKPIAITLKDDSVINGGCRDLLGDQLVPVEVAGKEYVVLKGFLNTSEFLFITATEDDTEIFIGGSATPITRLQAGGLYRHQVTTPSTYIVSTKTIYVFHVTGFGCEMGMAILPSINCKGSQQIGFSRTTSEFFGLNILIRKEGVGHFRLNGSTTLVPANVFSPVPGTNDAWYAAQLSFNTVQIPVGQASMISNLQNSFQVGIINGNSTSTCRYGYFSAFSTLFIGDDFDFCEGETALLDAGPGKESYVWNTGATTQKIEVTTPGSYWVKIEKEECILSDTIHVDVKKGSVDLGPDVEVCEGAVATIDGKENFSWHWSDGTHERYLKATQPGKYWVNVFDYTGCEASDTIVINKMIHLFDDDVNVRLDFVSVDTAAATHVYLAWTVTASEAVESNKVILYRKADGGVWIPVKTLPAHVNTFKDDLTFPLNGAYDYYASLTNRCGEELLLSPIHRTIYLMGQADSSQNLISLNWNQYEGWNAGVERYEIWRKLDDQPGFKLVAEVSGSENSFVAPMASDGFRHYFVVRAVEAGEGNASWSTTLLLELEHPVKVPNVFTPNGDEFNEHFHIEKIELYNDAQLLVIDRWGKKVFESTGYKNDWNGDGLSAGVYYYILNLRRDNKVLKGPISILR